MKLKREKQNMEPDEIFVPLHLQSPDSKSLVIPITATAIYTGNVNPSFGIGFQNPHFACFTIIVMGLKIAPGTRTCKKWLMCNVKMQIKLVFLRDVIISSSSLCKSYLHSSWVSAIAVLKVEISSKLRSCFSMVLQIMYAKCNVDFYIMR